MPQKGIEKMITLLLIILLALVLGAIVNFPVAGVVYLLYKLVILAIFPTLPAVTFWQMYGITILLSIIGSFFKSSTVVKKD